ncbi:uncharacterized protein LOC135221799 [Macrobrachium nipponense]|uniref:uncharacterized protein LOC135221799 n=1 Tax=Macrobrachium nipponense TaxID=159736 RepID=UPI0030C85346
MKLNEKTREKLSSAPPTSNSTGGGLNLSISQYVEEDVDVADMLYRDASNSEPRLKKKSPQVECPAKAEQPLTRYAPSILARERNAIATHNVVCSTPSLSVSVKNARRKKTFSQKVTGNSDSHTVSSIVPGNNVRDCPRCYSYSEILQKKHQRSASGGLITQGWRESKNFGPLNSLCMNGCPPQETMAPAMSSLTSTAAKEIYQNKDTKKTHNFSENKLTSGTIKGILVKTLSNQGESPPSVESLRKKKNGLSPHSEPRRLEKTTSLSTNAAEISSKLADKFREIYPEEMNYFCNDLNIYPVKEVNSFYTPPSAKQDNESQNHHGSFNSDYGNSPDSWQSELDSSILRECVNESPFLKNKYFAQQTSGIIQCFDNTESQANIEKECLDFSFINSDFSMISGHQNMTDLLKITSELEESLIDHDLSFRTVCLNSSEYYDSLNQSATPTRNQHFFNDGLNMSNFTDTITPKAYTTSVISNKETVQHKESTADSSSLEVPDQGRRKSDVTDLIKKFNKMSGKRYSLCLDSERGEWRSQHEYSEDDDQDSKNNCDSLHLTEEWPDTCRVGRRHSDVVLLTEKFRNMEKGNFPSSHHRLTKKAPEDFTNGHASHVGNHSISSSIGNDSETFSTGNLQVSDDFRIERRDSDVAFLIQKFSSMDIGRHSSHSSHSSAMDSGEISPKHNKESCAKQMMSTRFASNGTGILVKPRVHCRQLYPDELKYFTGEVAGSQSGPCSIQKFSKERTRRLSSHSSHSSVMDSGDMSPGHNNQSYAKSLSTRSCYKTTVIPGVGRIRYRELYPDELKYFTDKVAHAQSVLCTFQKFSKVNTTSLSNAMDSGEMSPEHNKPCIKMSTSTNNGTGTLTIGRVRYRELYPDELQYF